MKRIPLFLLCLVLAPIAMAQEKVIPSTGWSDNFNRSRTAAEARSKLNLVDTNVSVRLNVDGRTIHTNADETISVADPLSLLATNNGAGVFNLHVGQQPYLLVTGDSMNSVGSQSGGGIYEALMAKTNFQHVGFVNASIPGLNTTVALSYWAEMYQPLMPATNQFCVVFAPLAANDAGSDVAKTNMLEFAYRCRTNNAYFIASTVLSLTAGVDANYNDWVRATWTNWADAFFDWYALGGDNATNYSDGVHPTTAFCDTSADAFQTQFGALFTARKTTEFGRRFFGEVQIMPNPKPNVYSPGLRLRNDTWQEPGTKFQFVSYAAGAANFPVFNLTWIGSSNIAGLPDFFINTYSKPRIYVAPYSGYVGIGRDSYTAPGYTLDLMNSAFTGTPGSAQLHIGAVEEALGSEHGFYAYAQTNSVVTLAGGLAAYNNTWLTKDTHFGAVRLNSTNGQTEFLVGDGFIYGAEVTPESYLSAKVTTRGLEVPAGKRLWGDPAKQVAHGGVDDGLILYWPLNETNTLTAYDYSGNGNDGTATSLSTLRNDPGVMGWGASFHTTNWVAIQSNASFNGLPSFSCNAWFNFTTNVPNSMVATRSSSAANIAGDWAMYLETPEQMRAYVSPESTLNWLVAPVPNATNAWHMMTLVYDGATASLWLDGSNYVQTAVTGSLTPNAFPFSIGQRGVTVVPYGFIDEVKLWRRPLRTNEIVWLFRQGGTQ